MNVDRLIRNALIGGLIGGGAGLGHKMYTGDKQYGSPILGAELGAGIGALWDAIQQNKEEKFKPYPTTSPL